MISGLVGLSLCLAQAVQGHVNAKHEHERMQEAHEQKMHFLYEMHRQHIRTKNKELERKEWELEAFRFVAAEKGWAGTGKMGMVEEEHPGQESGGGVGASAEGPANAGSEGE